MTESQILDMGVRICICTNTYIYAIVADLRQKFDFDLMIKFTLEKAITLYVAFGLQLTLNYWKYFFTEAP